MQPQTGENDPPPITTGHFYRCIPNIYSPEVAGGYLIDCYGTDVQFFSIFQNFELKKTLTILDKQDQYCAQIGVISPQIIIIYGALKFFVIDIVNFEVVEKVKFSNYIEKCLTKNEHVVILTTEQQSQNKLIHCWKINPKTGKVEDKYKSTPVIAIDYEECTQDNIQISLIMSIDNTPRVYIYWSGTGKMIEVDPLKQQHQQYFRQKINIKYITDLSPNTYAEIIDKTVNVSKKAGGKRIAELINQSEIFQSIFSDGSQGKLYTISNLGIKRWKLQSNAQPVFYNFSDKYKVDRIAFLGEQSIIGINNQTKTIVIWKDEKECKAHYFPNQMVRKIVQINERYAVILLEVTQTQSNEQDQINKYNKLQVYDFKKDKEIGKKAMKQAKFSIDIQSLLVTDGDTIRFFVNEQDEKNQDSKLKKYIFRWTPFITAENQKDTKKKQIKDAHTFSTIKMYPFNKIIALNCKSQEESYSVFSKKGSEAKTQLVLFDFGAKKIGDYDLQGHISVVEISEKNQIYTVIKDKVNIYAIHLGEKNRLQKINQLDITVTSLRIYKDYLLIRKSNVFLLLDQEFQCVMREDIDENDSQYKILPYSEKSFLLKTEKTLAIWDYEAEVSRNLKIPECEPNLMQYMSEKIMVVDQWIQAYDVCQS